MYTPGDDQPFVTVAPHLNAGELDYIPVVTTALLQRCGLHRVIGQGEEVTAVRRAATVPWEPHGLWSFLAEETDLPRESASWSSRVTAGPDGALHHERLRLDKRFLDYEFEMIDRGTGQRWFAERVIVRPHTDGSLVERSGEAPTHDVAVWMDDLFAATLRSLAALADDPD